MAHKMCNEEREMGEHHYFKDNIGRHEIDDDVVDDDRKLKFF